MSVCSEALRKGKGFTSESMRQLYFIGSEHLEKEHGRHESVSPGGRAHLLPDVPQSPRLNLKH